jgi:hypothetical protein
MVETRDANLSAEVAERIANGIKEINLENLKCVE